MRTVESLTGEEATFLRLLENADRCDYIPSIGEWGARIKVWVGGKASFVEEGDDGLFTQLLKRGLVGWEFVPNGYNYSICWITEDGRRALAFWEEEEAEGHLGRS